MVHSTNNLRLFSVNIALIMLCYVLALPQKGFGQQPNYTPGKFLDTVVDNLGNKYSLGEIAVNDTMRAFAHHAYSGTTVSTCSSGYFQMYFETGCGLEGSAPANVARRDVVCRVLYDLSQFLHSPLSTVRDRCRRDFYRHHLRATINTS
jgi:hypothetical protein